MRVGPYEVLGKAGAGAMGVVYRARDPALGRDVALKVMSAAGGDAGRFATEMQALARLRHENVVLVHAAGADDGAPFLAMEWVDGTTLRERLRRGGPLPELEARRIVGGVARALEYAHARGVVHRDVKPENVLLGADGRVLLADFGLARLLGRETRVTVTGEIVGTPTYAAPEQASGDVSAIGPATDVWALGVLLFEALTGATPFQRSSLIATLDAILHQPPPTATNRRRDLDPALEALIRRCLDKAPAGRGTAGEVAAALEGDATRARTTRSRPPLALLALAGAVVVAAVVALALAGDRPPAPAPPVSLPPPRPVSGPRPKPPFVLEGLRHLPPEQRPPLPVPDGLFPLPGPEPRWINQRDGSVLRWVPPGRFTMRAIDGTDRVVEVPRGVFLAEQEVRVGQVRQFARETRRRRTIVDPGADPDARATLDWFEAQEYCRWAGLRLPTEAEWCLGSAHLAGQGEEWLQDRLGLPPGVEAPADRDPPPSTGERVLGARRRGAGPSDAMRPGLRPGIAGHAITPDEQALAARVGFRVALGPDGAARAIPLPRWALEAFDFAREDERPEPPGPTTPLDALRRRARHRISVERDHLDLSFWDLGPGELLLGDDGAPIDPAFPKEWFLVVATTRVTLPAGRWGVYVRTDDGVRVWRDGALVIDEWRHQPERLNTATFSLDAPREVAIRIEYFENHGAATLIGGVYPD